jgi:NAD(P)-dependent dehydrogenase (short-subunit alcohol dehydrogenase family)
MKLEGRKALVTGASSGVGRAVARALVREGATTCLTGRSEPRLREATGTAEEVAPPGTRAFYRRADLRDEGEIRALVSALEQEAGGLDLLVHSAGTFGMGPVEETSAGELDRLYETNLRAPVLLTRALLPLLEERESDVVFVNSSVGVASRGGVGAYAASKHGLRAVADSLRDEVNPRGIRVLSLYLGRTATPMQERIFEKEGREYRPDRLIQADELAGLLVDAVAMGRSAEVTDLHVRPAQKP